MNEFKSSNDLYHGDEHLTDKPQRYMVRCSEVITYEVDVEAMDEEEAHDKALDELAETYDLGNYMVETSSFQVDSIKEMLDIKVGGTD